MRLLAIIAVLGLGGCCLRYVLPAFFIGDPSGDSLSTATAPRAWSISDQKGFDDCVNRVVDAGIEWNGRPPCPRP